MGKLAGVKKAIDAALDMRAAARMKRAEKMGFDTKSPLYHGTDDADFDRFNLDNFGQNYGTWGEPSVYLTSDKDHALDYGSEVKEVFLNKQNTKKIDGEVLLKEVYDSFESYQAVPFNEWRDSLTRNDIYEVLDFDQLIGSEAVHAKASGAKGIDVDFNDTSISLAFDPKNIRSVNAAFDPAKKESSNLLAGLGGAGILGASMLTPEQAAAADSFAAQDNDGIYADEYPTLDRIGTALNKIEFPIMGKPLEGTGRYLQRFGEPRTKWQQLKDAYGAAFDFL